MTNSQLIRWRFVGLLAGCLFSWSWVSHPLLAQPGKPGAGGPPPAPVVVDTVIEQEVALGKPFVGTLEPRRRSIVGSAVDGRVVKMLVEEGDWVTEKQPLAQLLTGTIEIEIAGAEAELALRQAELDESENGSRPEEILLAKAKWDETKAVMEYTRERKQRLQRLFENGSGASREEYEQSNSNFMAAWHGFLAAQAQHAMAIEGPRKERKAQALARRDSAQEMVNLLKDRLEKYTLRSPYNGYVKAKHTEIGEWINKGDQVAEVLELDPIAVVVSVPESDITGLHESIAHFDGLRQSTAADIRPGAMPNQVFQGQVARIVPEADLRSRTFPVKVYVANPIVGGAHLLKAGMLANVTIPVGKPQRSTLVPKDALVLGGPTPMVYVVGADPTSKQPIAMPVPVRTGLSQGNYIQVTGEIAAGKQVVVRGNERLRPMQPIAPAMRTGGTSAEIGESTAPAPQPGKLAPPAASGSPGPTPAETPAP